MFLKITEFHWLELTGPALAIAGLALLIAAGSIFIYLRPAREREEGAARGSESGHLKRLVAFGALMIGAGLAAFAVLGGGQLLTERFEFTAPAAGDVGRIYYQPLTDNRAVPVKEMIRKTSYKIVKEDLMMTSNGYIETPFMLFGAGPHILEFRASGDEAENERARLLVAVLELNKDGTGLAGKPFFHELTPDAKTYRIPMRTAPGMIGAVRIEFVNAATKTKGKTRIAIISKVEFKRG